MKKIIITIGLAVLVLIGFSFYWVSIRPSNIRKRCFAEAKKEGEYMLRSESILEARGFPFTRGNYEKVKNTTYDECLLKNGMSK